MDDPRLHPRDSAGPAPHGAARRRPVRDVRPQRPVPPRDQPQQPPEAAAGAGRAGHHRPQREAYAAGGRGRPDRQRPPRPPRDRAEQPPAQVPLRHAEGQAGALPPEPAGQARGLFGPLGHRGRPGAEDVPVRPAEGDGAGALQAVRDEAPGRDRRRRKHQGGAQGGRARQAGGLGCARNRNPQPPRAAEPRADAAPPGHPGL